MNIKELNSKFQNCSCKLEHICPIDYVNIGEDATNSLTELCKPYSNVLLVSDENTYEVCGEKVFSILNDKIAKNLILKSNGKVVIPNEESIAAIENAITDKNDLIIGIGSGVINDLCKYVSYFNHLPYYIVATAPSMDGYASVGAAMILNGMKVTVNACPPKAIIADTEVLKNAPIDMLKAGYGDIIGKYSCLNDWKLSALINDEYFCKSVYDLTLECAKNVATLADGILNRDAKTVGVLMEALVIVGIMMSYVGSSRPASGSEHHMSHFFEITGILENTEYFAHGTDVIYSSVCTQKLREELLKIDELEAPHQITNAEYQEKIKEIYHGVADEVIALQDKMGWYKTSKFDTYKKNWNKIKEILAEAPSSLEMQSYVEKIGLNMDDFKNLYGDKKIQNAIWFAKDLKDRYSVLWLYFDLMYK
ncbi:MAG: sn-glycerol-1-phosphate dehydrogenase [Ruminococcaceae bacterium]|nr:sn-glycerol-1-phosphate dehydrogenase [Oscillospiraceae bacterium]